MGNSYINHLKQQFCVPVARNEIKTKRWFWKEEEGQKKMGQPKMKTVLSRQLRLGLSVGKELEKKYLERICDQ